MAEPISAAEAMAHFLNSLEPEQAREERPAVERMVQQFGEQRPISELTGEDVAAYAAELGVAGLEVTESELRLEPLRAFLAYCARLAFTDENLVHHLPLPEIAEGGADAVAEPGGRGYYVTLDGLKALEAEHEELKAQRPQIAEDLRAAMADKDFRENAPLDAARDSQAHLEARIRAIEDHLRRAVIIDAGQKHGRANVGSTVRVLNLEQDREQTFVLVSPGEVDPTKGKISVDSPFGRAMNNRGAGDEVEVTAPGGKIRLKVLEVIG